MNELLAYNITISPLTPSQFFRSHSTGDVDADTNIDPDPSLNSLIHPTILSALPGACDADTSIPDHAADYLGYLDLATHGGSAMRERITDFARETLKVLGFTFRNALLCTRYDIPFTICGADGVVQTDVCLLYRRRQGPSLVLVVANEHNPESAQSHVIACAIAAFQSNSAQRASHRLHALDEMLIPCITLYGTRPTFYVVPVTSALSTAVIAAQFPASETWVSKCVTPAAFTGRVSEGVGDREYRNLALGRFVAFKTLVRGC